MLNKINLLQLFQKVNPAKIFFQKIKIYLQILCKLIQKITILLLISCVKIYQIILSPFVSHNKCRFNPSCSNYMIEAITKKGAIKGLAIGTWRLCRCHPWSEGGNDFVK